MTKSCKDCKVEEITELAKRCVTCYEYCIKEFEKKLEIIRTMCESDCGDYMVRKFQKRILRIVYAADPKTTSNDVVKKTS